MTVPRHRQELEYPITSFDALAEYVVEEGISALGCIDPKDPSSGEIIGRVNLVTLGSIDYGGIRTNVYHDGRSLPVGLQDAWGGDVGFPFDKEADRKIGSFRGLTIGAFALGVLAVRPVGWEEISKRGLRFDSDMNQRKMGVTDGLFINGVPSSEQIGLLAINGPERKQAYDRARPQISALVQGLSQKHVDTDALQTARIEEFVAQMRVKST